MPAAQRNHRYPGDCRITQRQFHTLIIYESLDFVKQFFEKKTNTFPGTGKESAGKPFYA